MLFTSNPAIMRLPYTLPVISSASSGDTALESFGSHYGPTEPHQCRPLFASNRMLSPRLLLNLIFHTGFRWTSTSALNIVATLIPFSFFEPSSHLVPYCAGVLVTFINHRSLLHPLLVCTIVHRISFHFLTDHTCPTNHSTYYHVSGILSPVL